MVMDKNYGLVAASTTEWFHFVYSCTLERHITGNHCSLSALTVARLLLHTCTD